jgi:HTH-type transcriptional regulator/antitoxin HipB
MLSSISDNYEFPMRIKAPLDLGLVIRDQRRKARVSQTELARRAGVGRQWLVGLEKGKPGAELGLVLRTLAALELAISIDEGGSSSPAAADALVPSDIDAVVQAAREDRT